MAPIVSTMLYFAFVTVLVTVAAAAPSCCPAAPECRFVLCDASTEFPLSSPADRAVTSAVCLPGSTIGVVHSAPAYIYTSSGFELLKDYKPIGMSQRFSPHFFKTFSTGVGHETVQKGQEHFLDGACIKLPITAYQQVQDARVVGNAHPKGNPLVDCVSFCVTGSMSVDTPTPKPSDPMSPPTQTSASIESMDPTKTPVPMPHSPSASTTVSMSSAPVPSSPPDLTSAPELSQTLEPIDSALASPTPHPSVPDVVGPDAEVPLPPLSPGSSVSFSVDVEIRKGSGTSKEDLYLLSDATRSMGGAIADVKENFQMLVDARINASDDVAFGVGYYRDEDSSPPFETLQNITKRVGTVKRSIESLFASGGGDISEANLLALYTVATDDTIGWREGSRRVLVYFGDAPGHEPTCIDGLRLTRSNVVKALNRKKITVVATDFSGLDSAPTLYGCTTGDSAGSGQATAITEGTGGQLVEAEEQADLIESIVSSVGSLNQTLEADTSDCDKIGVIVTFEPELPLVVGTDTSVSVRESVTVSKEVCDRAGMELICEVLFTLSGADTGTQTISSSVSVDGCA